MTNQQNQTFYLNNLEENCINEIDSFQEDLKIIGQNSNKLIRDYDTFPKMSREGLVEDFNSTIFKTLIVANKRIIDLQNMDQNPKIKEILEHYKDLKSQLKRIQNLFSNRLSALMERRNHTQPKEEEIQIKYENILNTDGTDQSSPDKKALIFDLEELKQQFQLLETKQIVDKLFAINNKINLFYYQATAISQMMPEIKKLKEAIEQLKIVDPERQAELIMEKIKLQNLFVFFTKVDYENLNANNQKPKPDSLENQLIKQTISASFNLKLNLDTLTKNQNYNQSNLTIKKIIDFWQNFQINVNKISPNNQGVLNHQIETILTKNLPKLNFSFNRQDSQLHLLYHQKDKIFDLNNCSNKIITRINQANALEDVIGLIDQKLDNIAYFKKTLNFYQKSQFKQKILASILRTQNPTSTKKILNNLPIIDLALKKALVDKITILKNQQIDRRQKEILAQKTQQLGEKIINFLQNQQKLTERFANYQITFNKYINSDQKDKTSLKSELLPLKKDYQKQEIDYLNLLLVLNKLNLKKNQLLEQTQQLVEVEKQLNNFKEILNNCEV